MILLGSTFAPPSTQKTIPVTSIPSSNTSSSSSTSSKTSSTTFSIKVIFKKFSRQSHCTFNALFRIPTRLNKFEHFKANQGFNTSKKHQQIRRREGTEIFEGRKPDIIHYIESPQLGTKVSYSGLIDERTPKTSIVKESTFSVPNVIVGYIGN